MHRQTDFNNFGTNLLCNAPQALFNIPREQGSEMKLDWKFSPMEVPQEDQTLIFYLPDLNRVYTGYFKGSEFVVDLSTFDPKDSQKVSSHSLNYGCNDIVWAYLQTEYIPKPPSLVQPEDPQQTKKIAPVIQLFKDD